MTAVSTKVPASRMNGSPAGGPMPMPRVVGNRRIRTGGIALATMLLAFGAALSGIALVSVAKTSAYLAVAKPVAVGSQIAATDLTTVQLSGGGGLTLIPAVEPDLGRRPARGGDAPAGHAALAESAHRQAAGRLRSGAGRHRRRGTQPAGRDAVAGRPDRARTAVRAAGREPGQPLGDYDATVVDVVRWAATARSSLHIAISADLAPTIVH